MIHLYTTLISGVISSVDSVCLDYNLPLDPHHDLHTTLISGVISSVDSMVTFVCWLHKFAK